MRIAGIQKNSFIDYPGKIAAVLFAPGCNFNCFFCHNRPLIDPKYKVSHTEDEVLEFLERRKGMLDAVVISGGEPTLQPDLHGFIRRIRRIRGEMPGYSIKLDTNGSIPDVIRKLLADDPSDRAVDYIAMDIKAPFDKYDEICGVKADGKAIRESISLIMGSGVPYEFRTTVVPQLGPEDIMEMAGSIRGASLYALQQYRKPQGGLNSMAPSGTGNMVPAAITANGIIRESNDRGEPRESHLKADADGSTDRGAKDDSKGAKDNSIDIKDNSLDIKDNSIDIEDNSRDIKNNPRIIDIRLMKAPYTKAELEAMADSVKGIVHDCIVRGV